MKRLTICILFVATTCTLAAQTNTFPSSGNVGIGTVNPRAVLDVGTLINDMKLGTVFGRLPEGNGSAEGTLLGVRGYGTQPHSTKSFAIEFLFNGNTNSSINFYRGSSVMGGFLTFNTNDNSERMRINPNGNVGIGTTAPNEKLSVNGNIRAKEIKVETANWPDYVFALSHKLPSLANLEKFIRKYQHLPEIPTAEDVKESGLDLGDMNARLLKKIEELTLYLIDQNKKLNEQEKKLEEQGRLIEVFMKKGQ